MPSMMELYHGGVVRVNAPAIPAQDRPLDYGSGFYTTSDRRQAERWARKVASGEGSTPVMNIYDFDAEAAEDNLIVIRFHDPTPEWLDFVLSNRRNQCRMEYDMAVGPVADDKVFSVIVGFENGIFDFEEAVKRLKSGPLSDQYLFHTERSLRYLRFIGSEAVR